MVYDLNKKKPIKIFNINKTVSNIQSFPKIKQIEELPQEIPEIRGKIFYIMSKENLYCFSLTDFSLKSQYFKK